MTGKPAPPDQAGDDEQSRTVWQVDDVLLIKRIGRQLARNAGADRQ